MDRPLKYPQKVFLFSSKNAKLCERYPLHFNKYYPLIISHNNETRFPKGD